jgi:hypothetical protein
MDLRSIYKYAYDYADLDRDYICEVDLPEAWFVDQVDGFLAIRLLHAGLHVFHAAGQELGIGMPSLRIPKGSEAIPAIDRLFDAEQARADPKEQPEFAWAEDQFNKLDAGGILIIGRGDAGSLERERQQAVTHALNATDEGNHFTGEEVSLRSWTAPGPG